jgi:four helix bundle protein
MSDFKKLKVWRKAHSLALNVHRAATRIRGRDQISLRGQMLRAALSIPANIVEGTGKGSAAEFCRFLSIAVGSASELEYHLMMARDLQVLSNTEFDSLHAEAIEIRKMLCGLISKVKSPSSRPPRAEASASS